MCRNYSRNYSRKYSPHGMFEFIAVKYLVIVSEMHFNHLIKEKLLEKYDLNSHPLGRRRINHRNNTQRNPSRYLRDCTAPFLNFFFLSFSILFVFLSSSSSSVSISLADKKQKDHRVLSRVDALDAE